MYRYYFHSCKVQNKKQILILEHGTMKFNESEPLEWNFITV